MWLHLLLRLRSAPTLASKFTQCWPTAIGLAGMILVMLSSGLAHGQQMQRGRDLFAHRWEPNDKLSPKGDGLGPLFNGRSCQECHGQGGLGGGGSSQFNVDILSTGDSAKVLHKSSTIPEYERWRYKQLGLIPNANLTSTRQLRMLASLEQRKRLSKPVMEFKSDGIPFVLSHRNTPALFGAGLLDEISEDDIRNEGLRLAKQYPGVSGRFSGKFGWRGQTDSLEEFVLGACANELGLQFERHKQPMNPLIAPKPVKANDLSQTQADDLIKFVASLPAPRRVIPTHPQAAFVVRSGEQLFHTVGCTACHVADLGDVKDVYSDLLLHDMGPDLADPMPARGEDSTITLAAYGGTFAQSIEVVHTNVHQEWRTPPLWGVAVSAPYLHDGRALNLDEAIRLHGGEASFAAQRYMALDTGSRSRIVAFLQTMQPPR